MNKLVLSLFHGIGMLDSGFVSNGFCVVTGPERILNGCITKFKGIEGVFGGIIGGSPCVDYSGLNRTPKDYSDRMKKEFERIVIECQPDWFLLENVLRVPDVIIDGYFVQRFNISPRDIGFKQSRPRCFQFGSKKGLILNLPERVKNETEFIPCLTASQGGAKRRTFEDFCLLQGFDSVPELDSFTLAAKYKAVGNGVHIGVSNIIAKCVLTAITDTSPKTFHNTKICLCGCGRVLSRKKQKYYDGACRNRAFTKRHRLGVIVPGS